jgi:hypothetical protein
VTVKAVVVNVVAMKRGATISNDGEVSIYLDSLIIVGDAEDEDVAAKALKGFFSGSTAQPDDRIDGDAGTMNVLSVRVIDVLLSTFRLA